MNLSSSNPLHDSDLIDLELRSSGQSDAFLDQLDFILDEDGVADGDEMGILANSSSRRQSKSLDSVGMDIQELDGWYNTQFDVDDIMMEMSSDINSCHISRLCQSDMYEVEFTPQQQQRPPLCFRPLAIDAHLTESKYNEALQKLAESMQRTEETRRQVMLQRQIMMPTQPQQRQVQTQPQVQQPSPPSPPGRSISPGRSSILNAFFTGSRCTLTNGLDQSRKQLSMYMTQMNQQTF